MNAKRILFPTDFSTASDAGLPLAASLARDMGATLIVLHVEEPALAYGGGELYYGQTEPDHAALVRMLHQVKPADPKIPCEHRMLMGDPADEIIKAATDEGVDLIVLGTHGRSGLARFLMGSVAEHVVRKATCPVLTVKHPAAKKKNKATPVLAKGAK